MKDQLPYSFDDEPVSKFFYDLDKKKIEVHFTAYYDCIKDIYKKNHVFGRSKIGNMQKA